MSDAGGGAARAYVIGCDIGVTNVKTVLASLAGEVLSKHMTETHADSPDWATGVKRHLDGLQAAHGPAQSVGIAAPGIAAPSGESIFWMRGRLDQVQGLNWTRHLGRSGPVPVINDAQAALLGEVWQGAARGSRNVAMLTLGTGVGGALMVDGRLLRGAVGRAGHLGHISLDPAGSADVTRCPGSLESAIGNVTVESRSGGRFKTTHDLIAAHLAGDEHASGIWEGSIAALAAAVASIINVSDPEVFIIGGGIARAGAALFDPLKRLLDEFEWRPHGHRVKIVPAALGEYAGALGAAWNTLIQAENETDMR
jgi:glucokinase